MYFCIMVYTDDFFSFPIRVYKKEKAIDEAELNYSDVEWALGMARLPRVLLKEQRIYWYEGFSRDRTMEDVVDNGFDLTIVCTEEFGEFTCGWKREKFEQKLNEFMNKEVTMV
jgi:hypothetical protein